MPPYVKEKSDFTNKIKAFASTLGKHISYNNEWTIKGFIDIFKNIYQISTDTKVISKILELHLFPYFLEFAKEISYKIELATFQNWYPDLTFISLKNKNIKFAVDLKTTYRLEDYPDFCNGFTLGSHGEYFIDRKSSKNIQYPYGEYLGHYCLGIIYSRNRINIEETKIFNIYDLSSIPSSIGNFIFFAEEKWKIASDKSGSGNTANIGSIQKISDILSGNGVFAKAGEIHFDEYWVNFGRAQVRDREGNFKKLTTFSEYLSWK